MARGKKRKEDPHRLARDLLGLVAKGPELARARELLAAGRTVAASGLRGAARSVFLAALAEGGPLLVVAEDQERARRLVDDLEQLLPQRAVLLNPALGLYHTDPETGEVAADASLTTRLQVLRALGDRATPALVVSGATALLQQTPAPRRLRETLGALAVGERVDPMQLARKLIDLGYRRVTLVEGPGELALRGAVLDIFPLGARQPVRAELFGDEIEALRSFDPVDQRSTGKLQRYELPLLGSGDLRALAQEDAASLLDHAPPGTVVAMVDPARCAERLRQARLRFDEHSRDLLLPEQVEAACAARGRVLLELVEEPPQGVPELELPFQPAGLTIPRGELRGVTNELARLVAAGRRLTLACVNDAERERLAQLLADSGLEARVSDRLRTSQEPPGIDLVVNGLEGGLRHEQRGAWLIPSNQLFARHVRLETRSRAQGARLRGTAVESFSDLEEGAPVVHVSHGIAIFRGIVRRERDGETRDMLHLEFADDGALYVPTDRIGLVRRWVGPTGKPPKLSKLGGAGWEKKTRKATEAVRDLAAELLEVQAERIARPGHALPPDAGEQRLFEESFPYTDTPDQAKVTEEVKQDLQSPRAMDRVVCGDVGYGKTEIAIRAAFKVASNGRQVAVLAPTTVLAHQHHRSFSERFGSYPLRVEVVSRFRQPAAVRQVLKDTSKGEVDVLIGTHRLLSKDVSFKDLGLVVIDEEQRFGVEHKERLKGLRRTVDVLTLTATPIPRTLHLALSGARDISVLQTPPPGRTAVRTKVGTWNEALIKHAIERELARDGQVFFVHDRVKTIQRRADLIKTLVPECRVGVVHGQMPEREIEAKMMAFFEHELDVLVATTLIENGLDVKRANTLILDRADKHGLAEMHQIRGRVGRSDVPAFAYFMTEEGRFPGDEALKRLRAIEEYSDLGAGFQIAMRDLEIRGAGNVLGAEQSGHIVSVGYDLYCRLLRRAVAELRGELSKGDLSLERDLDLEAAEVEVELDVSAYVPDAYVNDAALKIECYRKLASAVSERELDGLHEELVDRYGPPPRVLDNLFKLRRARIRAAGHGVLKVSRQDRVLKLRCRSRERLEQGIRAWRHHLRPIDTHMLYVRMERPNADDEAQLDYLLELLAPLELARAETPVAKAAKLDGEKVRAERQRRLRARDYRAEQAEADKKERAEKREAEARKKRRRGKRRARPS
ncbi:MAG: transcription-repair coupling factor [Planctomycetota bacterium]